MAEETKVEAAKRAAEEQAKLLAAKNAPADKALRRQAQAGVKLSEADCEAIELEVLEEIEAEAREQAKKEYKEQIRRRARMKVGLDEPTEEVTVDVAPYCTHILLDNVVFFQGVTYPVRRSVAIVMREIMQKTWTHQAEVDGKSENFYRRARATRISPHGVVNSAGMMRA